jgi:hypothetical protein
VADRLVLPTLYPLDIEAIRLGQHQMYALVRHYIRENLCYRFLMVPDGVTAYSYEATIKEGDWEYGLPLLNPAKRP